MDEERPPLDPAETSDRADRSLVEDAVHLFEDGKTYLEAELQYQKSRAGVAGQGAGQAALLGLFAFAFGLLALLAITVGLLLALTPILTVWGAMIAVTLGLLLCAAGCALVARARWRKAVQHLRDFSEGAHRV